MAIALLVALAGCRLSGDRSASDLSPGHRRLIAATRGQRLFEARLTGFEGYAPCSSEIWRCTALPVPGSRAFERLGRSLGAIRSERPTSIGAEHARAVARLVVAHEREDLAAAVQALRRIASRTEDCGVWSDLAAAGHTLARAGEPGALLPALDAAERAVELCPRCPSCRFNRALIAEDLGVAGATAQLWEDAARVQNDGWSAEALARQRAIAHLSGAAREERLRAAVGSREEVTAAWLRAEGASQVVREFVEANLLGVWAEGGGHGGELVHARRLAAVLARAGGDAALVEHVAALERAAAAVRGGETARGAQHRLLAGRRLLYDEWNLREAQKAFSQAGEALRELGSPYAHWADFYLGLIAYYDEDRERADRLLTELSERVEDRPYAVLKGRIAWIQGLSAAVAGDHATSLERYREAEASFRRAGERQNQAAVLGLMGEELDALGSVTRAWDATARSLRLSSWVFDTVRMQSLLDSAVALSTRQGLTGAARILADQQVMIADGSETPSLIYNSHLRRARVPSTEPDREETARDLVVARQAIRRLVDPGLAERALHDWRLVRGELGASSPGAGTVRALDRAVAYYERVDRTTNLARAYVARSRARRELGQIEAAAEDLERVVAGREETLAAIGPGPQRWSYQEVVDRARRELVELQAVDLDDPWRALASAENRSWAEHPAEDVERLRATLPRDAVILRYFGGGDADLAWLLSRERQEFRRLPTAPGELASAGMRLARAGAGDPDLEKLLVKLYEQLVGPWEEALRDKRQLIVVPTGAAAGIPLELLVAPASGRSLIEDHLVSYALDAGSAAGPFTEKALPRGLTLVVGDPASSLRSLPALPHARLEAEVVASLYPGARLLLGRDASEEAVLAALPGAAVVHLALHSLTDHSGRAFVPLAGEDRLTAEVLARLGLDGLRLVVLSGCSTLSSRPEGPAVVSIARPFLESGVGAVVGSLWDVEDRVAERVFTDFHRRVSSGREPREALREAKLALARPDAGDPVESIRSGAFVIYIARPSHWDTGQPG